MKKILLATGLALASTASVSATDLGEVTNFIGSGFGYIPSSFVAYDSPRIFFEEHTENSDIFVLLNDDFQEIKRIDIPNIKTENGTYDGYTNIYFYNKSDDDIYPSYGLPFTQTVFNNDDNYEYITYSDPKCYKIVNDKGETLAQITPPEGYEWSKYSSVDIYQTGDGTTRNGFFLVVDGQSMDETNYDGNIYIVYKIDKATSSIQQVSAYTSKMDVNPRMVRQTPITVTLGENTDYTSIDLINMSGRVVQSVPVNDEKTVVVDTSRLGHGVYVVKASGKNQSQETCKIVVQ